MYKCQICDREIDDYASIAHVRAEEYILELIRRDHPEWNEKSRMCHKCIAYYRRLVKENEI